MESCRTGHCKRSLPWRLFISSCSYLSWSWLIGHEPGDRTKSKGFKLQHDLFRLDVGRNFLIIWAVKPWKRLLWEVLKSVSVEVFEMNIWCKGLDRDDPVLSRAVDLMTSWGVFPVLFFYDSYQGLDSHNTCEGASRKTYVPSNASWKWQKCSKNNPPENRNCLEVFYVQVLPVTSVCCMDPPACQQCFALPMRKRKSKADCQ